MASPPPPDKTKPRAHHPQPAPDKRGLVGERAPRTSGGAVGNGLGGSKARREMTWAGATPRIWDGGSGAGTRVTEARSMGPSHPGIPGAPRHLCRTESQVSALAAPPAPHLPLLTSRCLSLSLHHNRSCHRRYGPSHFPLSRLSRCRKLRLTPSQPSIRVTSGLGSTAFRAQASWDWLMWTAYLRVVGWVSASRVRLLLT